MTKKEVLDKIKKAKLGHKRWMSYAKAIHMGIPVDKDAAPMIETDCSFGQWYYGDGQIFSSLDTFQAIEQPHSMLHNKYMQIYKLKRKPLKTGFFTSKNSAQKKKNEELDRHMKQLVSIADMLMEALGEFEKEVKEMSDFEISKLS